MIRCDFLRVRTYRGIFDFMLRVLEKNDSVTFLPLQLYYESNKLRITANHLPELEIEQQCLQVDLLVLELNLIWLVGNFVG